ncbi:histone-lysine N-methyltransferase SETMAR [Plakobranchus ocellatus]|uniref:Histone-lysine N-methyltransferase SETMAR n=1 Tax=Plakobranchus ocellatus TaxID=259542 RepID=A0AAV4B1U8_9GAST|nr:histone-lysine N-methyltransferase SETMAR [Plakobranchus ocellatus]
MNNNDDDDDDDFDDDDDNEEEEEEEGVSAPLMNALLNTTGSNMATPIKELSKLEVRAVVRFLFSKGTKSSEIHKQIAETYGEGAMSRSRVYQ